MICQGSGDGLTMDCDLTRNGDSVGGIATAVWATSSSVCGTANRYCVWGTDNSGTDFCCALAGGAFSAFEVRTGAEGDEISFQYSTYNMENGGSAYHLEGRVMAGAGDDTITGSRKNDDAHYTDVLHGDGDSDTIYGDAGGDHITGDAGSDFTRATPGTMLARGEPVRTTSREGLGTTRSTAMRTRTRSAGTTTTTPSMETETTPISSPTPRASMPSTAVPGRPTSALHTPPQAVRSTTPAAGRWRALTPEPGSKRGSHVRHPSISQKCPLVGGRPGLVRCRVSALLQACE